ncbi:SRPBCC family protein [Tahibacter soli]|uniref:SRPBCC family protein n=1 Tax=Tahibacter soli TaxID=2983605 RepID=A0A9X4BJR6_9GAMM|nr:SRPBCC family protein [Tahibacter soli]MDC8012434.1 SRPBCC family protein [Tahibacter soli]
MIKTVIIVLVVVIAAILIYAATKPDAFVIQRSLGIKAPPERIFALINDFKAWPQWSPYEKRDPAMQRTLGGSERGKGATYAWEGNKDVGQGRMEITESTEPSRIAIKLDFIKPFEAHNTAEFTLVPSGDTTIVTWAMRGEWPYISKVMGVFVNMDRLIGTDFEAGLASLKTLAEK